MAKGSVTKATTAEAWAQGCSLERLVRPARTNPATFVVTQEEPGVGARGEDVAIPEKQDAKSNKRDQVFPLIWGKRISWRIRKPPMLPIRIAKTFEHVWALARRPNSPLREPQQNLLVFGDDTKQAGQECHPPSGIARNPKITAQRLGKARLWELPLIQRDLMSDAPLTSFVFGKCPHRRPNVWKLSYGRANVERRPTKRTTKVTT